jgi:hypothetical protein
MTERLGAHATRLRSDDDLDAEAALALVDACARLATDAAAELDRRVRAAEEAG